MRILPAALVAALLPAIAADAQVTERSLRAAAPPATGLRMAPDCTLPGAAKASRPARPVAPQNLGDLPPANAIATVWRFDEKGCPKPVVLQRGIGANPEKAVEPTGHAAPTTIR